MSEKLESKKTNSQRKWFIFVVIAFLLFILLLFYRNQKAQNKWILSEMSGKITDVAIKKNDKYTFFKLDNTWIWVGTRNPAFEKKCYLGYYFVKYKGEEIIWLKEGLNSNDSISFMVNGADTVTSKTEICWIEKER